MLGHKVGKPQCPLDKGQKGVRRMEEGRKRDKRVKRRGEKEKKEDVGRGRQY